MSRRNEDYSWVVEIGFVLAGLIAWGLSAPAWLVLLLFAAGGIVFFCTSDGDSDGWDFNPFD